jgi:hypothetical protein
MFALAMTLESDDEHYDWANEALCVAGRPWIGATWKMQFTAESRGHLGFRIRESSDRDNDRDSARPARVEPEGRVHRSRHRAAYTHALARGEGQLAEGWAALRRHRPLHRPLAEGQVRRRGT